MNEHASPDPNYNENPITIRFTRDEFKEFVLETSQTPSEERRTFIIGFDITRADIKKFVEKINYLISTNNNLFSSEFSASIAMSETKVRKINAAEDFFNIENYPNEFSHSISITLSYFIFFKRSDGMTIPEKQIVNLRFLAGDKGVVDVEIRSTEFSWPESIFSHILSDIDALRSDVERKNPTSKSIFMTAHRIFRKFDARTTMLLTMTTMLLLMMLTTIITAESKQIITAEDIRIYSQQEKGFKNITVEEVLSSPKMSQLIEELRDADYLEKIIPQDNRFTRVVNQTKLFIKSVPVYFWLVLMITSIIVYFNIRDMKKINQNMVGRIWLSSTAIPDRDRVPPSGGVVESFVVSFFASLVFTALVSMVGTL